MLRSPLKANDNILIRQLPTPTAFINKDFKVVFAADKWTQELNFNKGEVVDKTLQELFKKLEDTTLNSLKECFRGQQPQPNIELYTDHTFKERYIEWSYSPWFDEHENAIGAIVQTEDVGQRLKSELEKEKLEFLLQETSLSGKIGNWEYIKNQETVIGCQVFRNILEIDEHFELDLNNIIDFFKPGYDRNTISMAIYSATENKTSWNEKLQIITAKGCLKWVMVSGKPFYKSGKYAGLIVLTQDITDFVHKEQKTKANERLLRTLINNIPIQVHIKDTKFRKILANKSELEFCGFHSDSDIIGKTDFDIFDKETAQKYREHDLEVMISQTPSLNTELVHKHADGNFSTFLTSKIPLKGENGEITGLVGINMDITDLKKKEKELKTLNHVTTQQNKKLINFAHIVSHNLRSHSANFSMLLDFLTNEEDEEEKARIMKMLRESSDNLMETLHNLNDIVTISSEQILLKKKININEKIHSILKNISTLLDENKATVICEIPDGVFINVVPSYFDSIILSLLTNAVRFKKPHIAPVIKISVNYVQNYTQIKIEDNGLGIDMKKNGHKLFGMYKTFHNNTSTKGLGLFIVKNQIEAMGGKINAQSQIDIGSTFNLYFNEEH
ncbi:PAS domain S-box-containing protein [Arenibacter nanhaiticus]|uniref:histidine kinase n=1 Tax=Arenibacter nanhaiticus TaxID=558155 RepID=A0A1M6HWJ5_9FLAO|nr:PAS domain-containing protein [Arenibacter nanhaiticus]SHJ26575.1 PAS domain S-box-containing protein [Arenibacter nanhaiticus]